MMLILRLMSLGSVDNKTDVMPLEAEMFCNMIAVNTGSRL